MDLSTMTDDDLDALRVAVLTEIERRRTITDAPAQAAALADRYSAAIGRKDGETWTQPTGAHDAYPLAATVTHDDRTWESLIPFNVWAPGVSGWRERVAVGYPAWVQPTGAHDAYPQGLHREPGSTTLASNLSFVHDAAMTVERAAEEETALVEGSFGTTERSEL